MVGKLTLAGMLPQKTAATPWNNSCFQHRIHFPLMLRFLWTYAENKEDGPVHFQSLQTDGVSYSNYSSERWRIMEGSAAALFAAITLIKLDS